MGRCDGNRRSFLSAPFLCSAVLLAVAAVLLRPAVARLQSYYSKSSIDIVRSLDRFETEHLPSFRLVPGGEGYVVPPETSDIGTTQWTFLVYRPRSLDRSAPRQKNVALLVSYYSDPRDQVPHTPEVCYRQGGGVVRSIQTIKVDTPALENRTSIEARLIDLELDNHKQFVLYIFYCNGKTYYDRAKVRLAIGMPGDRYIYFSKIEAIGRYETQDDRKKALPRCKLLLAEALEVLARNYYPVF